MSRFKTLFTIGCIQTVLLWVIQSIINIPHAFAMIPLAFVCLLIAVFAVAFIDTQPKHIA